MTPLVDVPSEKTTRSHMSWAATSACSAAGIITAGISQYGGSSTMMNNMSMLFEDSNAFGYLPCAEHDDPDHLLQKTATKSRSSSSSSSSKKPKKRTRKSSRRKSFKSTRLSKSDRKILSRMGRFFSVDPSNCYRITRGGTPGAAVRLRMYRDISSLTPAQMQQIKSRMKTMSPSRREYLLKVAMQKSFSSVKRMTLNKNKKGKKSRRRTRGKSGKSGKRRASKRTQKVKKSKSNKGSSSGGDSDDLSSATPPGIVVPENLAFDVGTDVGHQGRYMTVPGWLETANDIGKSIPWQSAKVKQLAGRVSMGFPYYSVQCGDECLIWCEPEAPSAANPLGVPAPAGVVPKAVAVAYKLGDCHTMEATKDGGFCIVKASFADYAKTLAPEQQTLDPFYKIPLATEVVPNTTHNIWGDHIITQANIAKAAETLPHLKPEELKGVLVTEPNGLVPALPNGEVSPQAVMYIRSKCGICVEAHSRRFVDAAGSKIADYKILCKAGEFSPVSKFKVDVNGFLIPQSMKSNATVPPPSKVVKEDGKGLDLSSVEGLTAQRPIIEVNGNCWDVVTGSLVAANGYQATVQAPCVLFNRGLKPVALEDALGTTVNTSGFPCAPGKCSQPMTAGVVCTPFSTVLPESFVKKFNILPFKLSHPDNMTITLPAPNARNILQPLSEEYCYRNTAQNMVNWWGQMCDVSGNLVDPFVAADCLSSNNVATPPKPVLQPIVPVWINVKHGSAEISPTEKPKLVAVKAMMSDGAKNKAELFEMYVGVKEDGKFVGPLGLRRFTAAGETEPKWCVWYVNTDGTPTTTSKLQDLPGLAPSTNENERKDKEKSGPSGIFNYAGWMQAAGVDAADKTLMPVLKPELDAVQITTQASK